MLSEHIHIVCLDVPYPADHGGMFDLFYKIVALHNLGVEIHLHCFDYGKGEQEELKSYCSQVYYYKRNTGLSGFSLSLPYIVSSRVNQELFNNLQKDNAPILLEGTHTTYPVYKNLFPKRTILFRLHNIERIYYYSLSKSEKNVFKKLYYRLESRLLKSYERQVLTGVSWVLPVSKKDASEVSKAFPSTKLNYLPVFLPFQQVNILQGHGNYCLYHGNLSVAENAEAAHWLANNLDGSAKLIVAGKNPSASLKKFLKEKNITLVADPSDMELLHLIQNVQINIVLSFNNTGIKLKLLNALFHGRYCVVNEAAIPDTEFESFCHSFSFPQELNQIVSSLMNKQFSEIEIEKRKRFLLNQFNNEANAKKLISLL